MVIKLVEDEFGLLHAAVPHPRVARNVQVMVLKAEDGWWSYVDGDRIEETFSSARHARRAAERLVAGLSGPAYPNAEGELPLGRFPRTKRVASVAAVLLLLAVTAGTVLHAVGSFENAQRASVVASPQATPISDTFTMTAEDYAIQQGQSPGPAPLPSALPESRNAKPLGRGKGSGNIVAMGRGGVPAFDAGTARAVSTTILGDNAYRRSIRSAPIDQPDPAQSRQTAALPGTQFAPSPRVEKERTEPERIGGTKKTSVSEGRRLAKLRRLRARQRWNEKKRQQQARNLNRIKRIYREALEQTSR